MWVEELQKEWNHLVDDPKYLESLYWCTRKEYRQLINGVRFHCYAMPSLGWTRSVQQTKIPRLGHLLVGIILRGPTPEAEMNFCVGNKDSKITLSLTQNEPTLIVGNENVLPLICLPYIELSLQFRTPVYIDLMYADLKEETCLNLVHTSLWLGFDRGQKWLYVHEGSGVVCDTLLRENHGLVIEMNNIGWKRECQRQQERTRQFEEELIQKTWHPQRFRQWCLDLNELHSI